MQFEITNKQLKKLDTEIFTFNKTYGMALNSLNKLPNIYAKELTTKKINELKSKLKKIQTTDEFEKLVVQNYLKNLQSQETYLEYYTTGKTENIDSLLKKVLGKNSIEIIKKGCKNFDYQGYWEYFLSYQEYTYRQIPSDEESLRETYHKILVDLKKDLLKYAHEHFKFPKDYNFDLILGQPYSQNTFFHPTNRRMEISPSRFFVFKDKNETKINVCDIIDVLFHELIGHGRHEINSINMPKSLRDNSINLSVPSNHVHAEGVAQITKLEAIKFMRKYQKKYLIEDDYLKQIELSSVADNNTMYIYYQYLQLKKLENPKLNIEKEFKKLTNNHGLFLLLSNTQTIPLSVVKNSAYPMGKHYLEQLISSIKKEIGRKKFQENHALINQAVSIGIWHFEVLPKFVRLFLKGKGVLK